MKLPSSNNHWTTEPNRSDTAQESTHRTASEIHTTKDGSSHSVKPQMHLPRNNKNTEQKPLSNYDIKPAEVSPETLSFIKQAHQQMSQWASGYTWLNNIQLGAENSGFRLIHLPVNTLLSPVSNSIWQNQLNSILHDPSPILYGLLHSIEQQKQNMANMAINTGLMPSPWLVQQLMPPVLLPQPVYIPSLMNIGMPPPNNWPNTLSNTSMPETMGWTPPLTTTMQSESFNTNGQLPGLYAWPNHPQLPNIGIANPLYDTWQERMARWLQPQPEDETLTPYRFYHEAMKPTLPQPTNNGNNLEPEPVQPPPSESRKERKEIIHSRQDITSENLHVKQVIEQTHQLTSLKEKQQKIIQQLQEQHEQLAQMKKKVVAVIPTQKAHDATKLVANLDKLDKLKKNLTTTEQMIDQLQGMYHANASEREKATTTLNHLVSQLQVKSNELNNQLTERSEFNNVENDSLQQRANSINLALRNAQKVRKPAKTNLTEPTIIESRIARLKDQIDRTKQTISHRMDAKQREKQLELNKDKKETKETELKQLQQKIENNSQTVREKLEQLKSRCHTSDKLLNEMQQEYEQCDQCYQQIVANNEKLQMLLADKDSFRQSVEQAKTLTEQSKQRFDALKTSNTSIHNQLQQWQDEFQKMIKMYDQEPQSIEGLKKQAEWLENHAKMILIPEESENNDDSQDLNDIRSIAQSISKALSNPEEFRSLTQKVQAEQETAATKLKERRSEWEVYAHKVSQLRHENQLLQKRLSQSKQQIDTIRKKDKSIDLTAVEVEQQRIEEANTQMDRLISAHDAAYSEEEVLQARLNSLTDTNKTPADIHQLQERYRELQALREDIEKPLDLPDISGTSTADAATTAWNILSKQLQQIDKDIERKGENEREIEQLQLEAKSNRQDVRAKLKQLENRYRASNAQLKKVQHQNKQCQEYYQQITTENNELKRFQSDEPIKQIVEKARKLTEQSKQTLQDLKASNATLQAQLLDWQNEFQQAVEQYDQRPQSADDLRQQVSWLKKHQQKIVIPPDNSNHDSSQNVKILTTLAQEISNTLANAKERHSLIQEIKEKQLILTSKWEERREILNASTQNLGKLREDKQQIIELLNLSNQQITALKTKDKDINLSDIEPEQQQLKEALTQLESQITHYEAFVDRGDEDILQGKFNSLTENNEIPAANIQALKDKSHSLQDLIMDVEPPIGLQKIPDSGALDTAKIVWNQLSEKLRKLDKVQPHKNENLSPEEKRENLHKHHSTMVEELWKKIGPKPTNISLVECKPLIKAYYKTVLCSDGELTVHFERQFPEFYNYFKNVRHESDYIDLRRDLAREALHELRQEIPNFISLCQSMSSKEVLTSIATHIHNHALEPSASIPGHPRNRMTFQDAEFIKEYTAKFKDKNAKALSDSVNGWLNILHKPFQGIAGYDDVVKKLSEIDFDKIREKIEKRNALIASNLSDRSINNQPDAQGISPEELFIIAKARKLLFDIQKSDISRKLDSSMLLNYPGFDDSSRKAYQKLLDIDQLHNDQIDKAQLQWLDRQHNKTSAHPDVIIEGAGPTGLMLALTQFEAGANVAVFEKRSTQYDRVQVVRLDPVWMNTLKFYLGERYYDLFEGDKSKGILRDDGFGEIVIYRLEDALHKRMTELMSLRNHDQPARVHKLTQLVGEGVYQAIKKRGALGGTELDKIVHDLKVPDENVASVTELYQLLHQPLGLERFAEHEIADIQQPQHKGEKYRVLVKTTKGDKQETMEHSRKADMLICAGGKNSQLCKEHLKPKDVPGQRYYGVATWEGPEIKNDSLNTFPDFRNILEINDQFLATLEQNFEQVLDSATLGNDLGFSEEAQQVLKNTWQLQKNVGRFSKYGKLNGKVLQLRIFENKGLIYLGMEIPDEIYNFINKIIERSLKAKNINEVERKGILVQLKAAWYQTIAQHKGFDHPEKGHATPELLNSKFAALFPVQQHRLENNIIEKNHNDGRLIITAAGDAAASPHFMRYSGLTGARENIFHLQNLSQNGLLAEDDQTRTDEIARLERLHGITANFVIARGRTFLDSDAPAV